MAYGIPTYGNFMTGGMGGNNYGSSPYGPQNGFPNGPTPGYNTAPIPQPQPQQIPVNAAIQGRMVTSREEALATSVDFTGNPIFLVDLAHKKIFMKKFNINTGASDMFEFLLNENLPQEKEENSIPTEDFISKKDFNELTDTVSQIQDNVDSLKCEIDKFKKSLNTKITSKTESTK